MKKILVVTFILSFWLNANSQGEHADSIKTNKKAYTYISIQANLLLQQFISFNSNSSINSNPYLFTFSKNSLETGWGTALGSGFNVSENSSNDGVSSIDVRNANVTFRCGAEKKFLQREKFIPFIGIEMGSGVIYNKTTSQLNQSFNANTVVTESTKIFFGPSFRGGLLFSLSKHILLGTEFFFNSQISYSENNGSLRFNSSFVPFNIGFQAPTALFLVFKY